MTEKMVAAYEMLDKEVQRSSAVDLLEWAEEKVLAELTRRVYRAGYRGTSWPELKRVPLALIDGEFREILPGERLNIYKWRVVAVVEVEPRD